MNTHRNAAFEMVRKHGFVEAARLCAEYRDMNSAGTFTFAHHNAVLKHITEAAQRGSMFRSA